jgi:putative endonuclease
VLPRKVRTRPSGKGVPVFDVGETEALCMNRGLGMAALRCGPLVGGATDCCGMNSMTNAELGALGEHLAVEHLAGLGLQVLERNWRCRYGELDVVAADPDARAVVFVEVKTRTSDRFGGELNAVTPQKVRRLRRLAGLWLAAHDGHWSLVRIDVIGVRIGRQRQPEITHLKAVG